MCGGGGAWGFPAEAGETATHRVLLQLGSLPPFCQLLGCRLWRSPGRAASSFSSQGHQARTPHSPAAPRAADTHGRSRQQGLWPHPCTHSLTPLGSSGQAWECMSEVLVRVGKVLGRPAADHGRPHQGQEGMSQMLILSDISGLTQLCLQCFASTLPSTLLLSPFFRKKHQGSEWCVSTLGDQLVQLLVSLNLPTQPMHFPGDLSSKPTISHRASEHSLPIQQLPDGQRASHQPAENKESNLGPAVRAPRPTLREPPRPFISGADFWAAVTIATAIHPFIHPACIKGWLCQSPAPGPGGVGHRATYIAATTTP